MNFDFSIESAIDKIQNNNTKQYFQEVYQTFVNGNYRSSSVMLYSVLICDLVYKLRDLRDIYNDSKAKKILEEIEEMQSKNPNSPDWESKLIEFIKLRTTLLESSDIVAIKSLQKFRHLSAHPVLNNADLLYSPNKETVQSLIRNILDGVLTNPPFFSSKIFDTMMADLVAIKDKIIEEDSLKRYINSRYLKRLKEIDFSKLFRSLWKIVFISDDKNAIENREINYSVLKIFIDHNKTICVNLVKAESHFYSNVNKDEHLSRIIHLISWYPEFYKNIEESLKLLIENKINDNGDFKLIAWFVYPTLLIHIKNLNPQEMHRITTESFNFVRILCIKNECEKELIDFAIEYFGESHSFDVSNSIYNKIISHIDNFSLVQVNRLFEVSNDNYQIYNRMGMKKKLLNIADNFDDEIDKSLYANIFPDE